MIQCVALYFSFAKFWFFLVCVFCAVWYFFMHHSTSHEFFFFWIYIYILCCLVTGYLIFSLRFVNVFSWLILGVYEIQAHRVLILMFKKAFRRREWNQRTCTWCLEMGPSCIHHLQSHTHTSFPNVLIVLLFSWRHQLSVP